MWEETCACQTSTSILKPLHIRNRAFQSSTSHDRTKSVLVKLLQAFYSLCSTKQHLLNLWQSSPLWDQIVLAKTCTSLHQPLWFEYSSCREALPTFTSHYITKKGVAKSLPAFISLCGIQTAFKSVCVAKPSLTKILQAFTSPCRMQMALTKSLQVFSPCRMQTAPAKPMTAFTRFCETKTTFNDAVYNPSSAIMGGWGKLERAPC